MTDLYKFQKLDVYKLALDYIRSVYKIRTKLPEHEKFNLSNQIVRAATSIALNIAEGSTGQSDPEQKRFLGLALRSYLETVACLDIIHQLSYLPVEDINPIREQGHHLFMKLSAFRKALN
jgi:four helix bundle protein